MPTAMFSAMRHLWTASWTSGFLQQQHKLSRSRRLAVREARRRDAAHTRGGFRFCTGSLLNSTAQDATPLFLTANHCLGGNIGSWQFMFNYESPSCADIDGPTNQTVVGGSLLFNTSPSDGALIELSVSDSPDL